MNKINPANQLTSAVHSYYQNPVAGNSYRYAGAAGSLYRDWVSVSGGLSSTAIPWPMVTMKPGLGSKTFTYVTDGVLQRKDDGTTVSTWGLAEPGSAATLTLGTAKSRVCDNFDQTTGWTVNNMTGMALDVDGANKVEGTASLLITNASAVVAEEGGSIRKTASVDLSTFSDASVASDSEYIRLWFMASDITLVKSISLILGIDGYDQYFGFTFENSVSPLLSAPSGVFFEIKAKKGDFVKPQDTTKTWANVNRLRVNLRFTKSVPIGSSFWFDDWSLKGGYEIDGQYKYRYILVEKSGSEVISKSNPFSLATSPIDISTVRIPVSVATLPSAGTKWVYRSLTTDFSKFFFDGEVASGTTTFSSNQADSALGEVLATDNNLPPLLVDFTGPHYDRIFGVSAALSDKIPYSKAKEPDAWPALNYLLIGTPGDPAKRVVMFEGVLFIFTVGGIYIVQGTDESSFVAIRTRAERGTSAPWSIAVGDRGIFYLTLDGIRVFDGLPSEIISAEIGPIFYGQSTLGIDAIDMTKAAKFRGVYFDQKYFLAYTKSGSTNNDRVLIYDEETRRWYTWDFNSARSLFVEKVNNYLALGADDGFVYYAEIGLQNVNGTDANSTATLLTALRDTYGHPGLKLAKDIYPDMDALASTGVTITPVVDGASKTAVTFSTATDRTVRRIRLPGYKGRVFEWRLSSRSYFRFWGMSVDLLDFQRGGYRRGDTDRG